MQKIDGIINLNKPTGITCADLVNRYIKHNFKISKVGYAGTLDKLAEGVLPILFNQATKISKFLEANDKEYVAEIKLGIETDTCDISGKIINTFPNITLEKKDIENVLPTFFGTIQQMPPVYSALKIKGQRASDLVRQGKSVHLEPRTIKIYDIKLLDFDKNEKCLTLQVKCSKGTYIRALARDIGRKLKTGGTIKKLVRTRNGLFTLAEAVTINQLEKVKDLKDLPIYSMSEVLKYYPNLTIKQTYKSHVFNGKYLNRFSFIDFGDNLADGIYKVSDKDQNLIALIEYKKERFYYLKVFHHDN